MTHPDNQTSEKTGNDGAAKPDLAAILASLPEGRRPPVHLWHPERIGEIDIRIARDGTWYHEGQAIQRRRMVKLFSTVLRLDGDGRYYLVTPVEKLAIEVEDAPFTAVEMQVHGAGPDQVLTFRSNVDEEIMAGPEHRLRIEVDVESGEPSPYVLIRDGLEALIARTVFYDLVDLAVEQEVEGKVMLGVWSAGEFFVLGEAGEAAT